MTNIQKLAMDLTKQPPRPPQEKLNGLVHLPRLIDKCRADLAGTLGEYKYNCPVDKMLFSFKEVKAQALKDEVAKGGSDQEIADWFMTAGSPRTREQIKTWSEMMIKRSPYRRPDGKAWFIEVCSKLGINPKESTLFDFLNADDKLAFAKK